MTLTLEQSDILGRKRSPKSMIPQPDFVVIHHETSIDKKTGGKWDENEIGSYLHPYGMRLKHVKSLLSYKDAKAFFEAAPVWQKESFTIKGAEPDDFDDLDQYHMTSSSGCIARRAAAAKFF